MRFGVVVGPLVVMGNEKPPREPGGGIYLLMMIVASILGAFPMFALILITSLLLISWGVRRWRRTHSPVLTEEQAWRAHAR